MKKTAAILAAGLAGMMAAAATASDGADDYERRAAHQERMQAWMDGIDVNDDGYIDADEAAMARESMFKRHDDNNDGRVTRAEMGSFIERFHRDRPNRANSQQMSKQAFEHMDRNNDGVINAQEYDLAGQQRFERMAGEDDRINISEVMDRIGERRGRGRD